MKALLEKSRRAPVQLLKAGYIGALSFIALLSLGAHFIISAALVEQLGSAETINTAGMQRTNAQRVAVFAQAYTSGGTQTTQQNLVDAATQMLEQHNVLTHASHNQSELRTLSPALQDLYFGQDVDGAVRDFVDAALRIAANDPLMGDLQFVVAQAEEPLLTALDAVVARYEFEVEQQVEHLHGLQKLLLFIVVAALVLEGLLIFRPLLKLVSDQTSQMFEMAMTDELTKVFNRRAWYDALRRSIAAVRRSDRALSVAVIDIDHFKKVNDTYGHDVGDQAIVHVAETIREGLRDSDVLGRVGGEEFCVVFPDTDQRACNFVCERIRQLVEKSPFKMTDGLLQLTVSIGVSTYFNEEIVDDFVKRADLNLYTAKRTGRNRVRSCGGWLEYGPQFAMA